MEASIPIRLVDIAQTIATLVEGQPDIAGLDRSGRAVTVGRNVTIRGVRVDRTADGEVFARVEIVGLLGTQLDKIGDRTRAAVEVALRERGLDAVVIVVVSDLADRKPESSDE